MAARREHHPAGQPGRRIGDGRYERLGLVLVVGQSSRPDPARVELPSFGGATVLVEPEVSGGVSIIVPEGLPPLEVAEIGGGAGRTASLNGVAVPVTPRSSLIEGL